MLRDHYSNVNIQHLNTTLTEICAPVQSLYDISDILMKSFTDYSTCSQQQHSDNLN